MKIPKRTAHCLVIVATFFTVASLSAQGTKPGESEAKPTATSTPSPTAPEPPGEKPSVKSVPIPKDATGVEYQKSAETIQFASPSNVETVTDFMSKNLEQQGWSKSDFEITSPAAAFLNRSKGGASVAVIVNPEGTGSEVTITTKGLSWEEVKPDQKPAATPKRAGSELPAEDRDGLPVPKGSEDILVSKTQFRQAIKAKAHVNVMPLVEFYRRELPARGWTESKVAAKTGAQRAELAFEGPLGGLTVNLHREGDATLINIATKNQPAAEQAHVRPKAGQGKLIIANSYTLDAVVTVNKQEYKIGAGAGANSLDDAVKQDVQPGKYTVAVKLPGRDVQTQTFQIAASDTWGVMIAPKGNLAVIQLY